jgi:TonB-linked SusC/RagA family outer membrane protein
MANKKKAIMMAMLVFCFQLALVAQNITLTLSNVTVKDAMETLRKNYDYSFVFESGDVDTQKMISLDLRNASIDGTVQQILQEQDVSYEIRNKNIVVRKQLQQTVAPQPRIEVRGVVTDVAGEPLTGAGIVEKRTTNSTVSDIEGKFTLSVSPGAVLVVSFIGYTTQEVVVSDRSNISIQLSESAIAINEVVVTALGIERKAKSLTYSVQQVGGDELTRAKETNMINALQGKTAGLVITPNANGAGSSSNIVLRGNKSINGDNKALVVIDGMPMNNYSFEQQTTELAGRDGGDALSNINPDDIASINVLKGASAAALYGSMAANGVVMITTKKGHAGALRVDVSSSTQFESILSAPKIQTTYGAVKTGDNLAAQSWGDKITGEAKGAGRVDDFFKTGINTINSVAIRGGSERIQNYVSYANTYAEGIVPENAFRRHQFMLRESFNLFDNRLLVDVSASYMYQRIHNRPHGKTYDSSLPGVFLFPANGDWQYYKDNYAIQDPITHLYAQQWYTATSLEIQNPWFVINRIPTEETRKHWIGSASATFNITGWLNLKGRLSYDEAQDYYEMKKYSGTASQAMAGAVNGRYQEYTYNPIQAYGDLMLNFNRTFRDFEISASVGTSFIEKQSRMGYLEGANLRLPDIFVYENFLVSSSSTVAGAIISGGDRNGAAYGIPNSRKRINSVFGTAQIGYKGMLYLDITARNDWSSALAFTPGMSYFYPSVGISGLLNEMIDLGPQVNMLKLRASYSIVGNDVPEYITYPMTTLVSAVASKPFDTMRPEKLHSIELGFEALMFANRLNVDFTWYKTNNFNQYFSMGSSPGTGYTSYYINAGNIQNIGFELTAGYYFDLAKDLGWKTDFNVSYNKNEIIELYDGVPEAGIASLVSATMKLQNILKVGGSLGDLYGEVVERDANGVVQLDANGNPKITATKEYLGSRFSPWNLGWGNRFSYKDISLYFLIDGRVGGITCSMTQSFLDLYGVSEDSGKARDNGGVDLGNGAKMDALQYYSTVAGVQKAVGEYAYSATNFRLRELSLGYTFRNLLGSSNNLTVSLTGRNLFFFYKEAPHDPSVSLSTGMNMTGIEYFGLPSTRTFGVDLKLSF